VYRLAGLLRQNHLKTGIIANVSALNAQLLRERGFYDGFDPIVLSYETGSRKPSPVMYQVAFERLGEKAEHVAFIDYEEKNVLAAQTLGMHAILAESSEQVIADVITLLRNENKLELVV